MGIAQHRSALLPGRYRYQTSWQRRPRGRTGLAPHFAPGGGGCQDRSMVSIGMTRTSSCSPIPKATGSASSTPATATN